MDLSVPLVLASTRAFYSSRPDSYNETQGPTGGPRVGKTICSRALMLGVANDVFNGIEVVASCRLALSRACAARRRDVGLPDTVVVHCEWAAGRCYTIAACCEWLAERRCPVAVLQTPCPYVLLAFYVPPTAYLTCARYWPYRVASLKIRARPDGRS
jgi:hypothetical protein